VLAVELGRDDAFDERGAVGHPVELAGLDDDGRHVSPLEGRSGQERMAGAAGSLGFSDSRYSGGDRPFVPCRAFYTYLVGIV
jgi:hypothetical protein